MTTEKNRCSKMDALYSRLVKRVRRLATGADLFKNMPPHSKTAELTILGKLMQSESDYQHLLKAHETQCSDVTRQNMDLKCIISRQGAELIKADSGDAYVAYLGEAYLVQLRLGRMLEYVRTLQDDVADLTRKTVDSRYALRPSYRDSQEALLRRSERRVDDLKTDIELVRMQLKGVERQIAAATGIPYVEEYSDYGEEEDEEEIWTRVLPIGIHNVFVRLAEGGI